MLCVLEFYDLNFMLLNMDGPELCLVHKPCVGELVAIVDPQGFKKIYSVRSVKHEYSRTQHKIVVQLGA